MILNDDEITQGFTNIISLNLYTLLEYTNIVQKTIAANYKNIVANISRARKTKKHNNEMLMYLHQLFFITDPKEISYEIATKCKSFITPILLVEIFPTLEKIKIDSTECPTAKQQILFNKQLFYLFRNEVMENLYIRYGKLMEFQESFEFVAYHIPKYNSRYANSYSYVKQLVRHCPTVYDNNLETFDEEIHGLYIEGVDSINNMIEDEHEEYNNNIKQLLLSTLTMDKELCRYLNFYPLLTKTEIKNWIDYHSNNIK